MNLSSPASQMDAADCGRYQRSNNQQSFVTTFISGMIFSFMIAYLQLAFLGGALILLVISRLFRNIGAVLVLILIALTMYLYFR